MEVLNYPGLPGAFLAVLFGGALSTMSSTLNSSAAVTWQDILKPFFARKSEAVQTRITKLLVVIYGAVGMGLAFGIKYLGRHVIQIFFMVVGTFQGPTLGIFSLGAFFPFANAKGAITGGVLSTAISFWIVVGNFLFDPHRRTLPTSIDHCNDTVTIGSAWSNYTVGYSSVTSNSRDVDIWNYSTADVMSIDAQHTSSLIRFYGTSFLLYPVIGCMNTLVIGIIVSLATGGVNKPVDRQLLIPFFDIVCPCLPATWRTILRCNVDYKHTTEEVNDRLHCRPEAASKDDADDQATAVQLVYVKRLDADD